MNPFLRLSSRQSLRPSAIQLFAWLALILLTGCGYGEVSSTTYEYAKSLYSITNRRMSDRLPQARQQIVAAREAGELPDKEAAWLLKIVDRAEDERWVVRHEILPTNHGRSGRLQPNPTNILLHELGIEWAWAE